MKIRRTSLLARAFFLALPKEEHAKPVTLCSFCATVFIALPLMGVLFLSVMVVAGPFILLGTGINWIGDRLARRRRAQPARPSVLVEWVRAKKRRVCPLVEFD